MQHLITQTNDMSGGAPRETRTPDPLITNQMLYRLSYEGNARPLVRSPALMQHSAWILC